MKRTFLKRLIALITVVIFLSQSVSFAADITVKKYTRKEMLSPSLFINNSDFLANFQYLSKFSCPFTPSTKRILDINAILNRNGLQEIATVAFDRGKKGREVFAIKIPKMDMRRKENIDLLGEYVITEIYNRAAVFGAEKILINCSEPLFDAISDKFHAPVDGRKDKGFHLIGNYFELVYGEKFKFKRATLEEINALKDLGKRNLTSSPKKGKIIGVDIGKSDVKAVILNNGEIKGDYKVNWTPKNYTKASDLLKQIILSIEAVLNKAKEKAPEEFKNIDAIGISINLAVNENKPTGLGPVLDGITDKGKYKNEEFKKTIHGMAQAFSKRFKTPVYIINDGNAAAVQVSVDMGLANTLAISLGSGLAGGFVDEHNQVTNWLTEMGNIVIDLSDEAVGHGFSKVKGAAQQYLSQRAVFRLAEKFDVKFPSYLYKSDTEAVKKKAGWNDQEHEAEKLKYIQSLFDDSTSENQKKVKAIFTEIARYIATFAQVTKSILNEDNLVLFGRVTEGQPGEYMLGKAREIAKEKNLTINITFPEVPHLTDEHKALIQTHGQAIGVAYYASQQVSKKNLKPNQRVVIFGGPDGVLLPYSKKRDSKLEDSPVKESLIKLLKHNDKVVIISNQRWEDERDLQEEGLRSRLINYIPAELKKNITLYVSSGCYKVTFDKTGREIIGRNNDIFNKANIFQKKNIKNLKKVIQKVLDNYWKEFEESSKTFKDKYPLFDFKKPQLVEHSYDGNSYGLTIMYLPSRAATVTNLSEDENDLRADIINEITEAASQQIEYFWKLSSIRPAGATSIDIRKKGTGKDHALYDYLVENHLRGKDVLFIGNLDYFSEDLPLGKVKGIYRLRNNLKNPKLINEDKNNLRITESIDSIFPYMGESSASVAGWLNDLSNNELDIPELAKRVNQYKVENGIYAASLNAALAHLSNIKRQPEWQLSDEHKIETLYKIYKNYNLSYTNQAAWTVLYSKAFDVRGNLGEAFDEVIASYAVSNTIDDFFANSEKIYEKFKNHSKMEFFSFFAGIDPRVARNLLFLKTQVYETDDLLLTDIDNAVKNSECSIPRVLSGYFQDNFIYKFKDSGLENSIKQEPPMLTYVGGGGVATTTLLRYLVEKNITSIAALVSSSDDGGSSWTLMLAILKTFGFFFIPPGDAAAVMIFTGADDAKVFSLFDIESTKKLPDNLVTAGKRITAKNVLPVWKDRIKDAHRVFNGDANIAGLDSKPIDFITFASGLMTLGDLIDRELINTGIIELKGTSTPNLLIMGAAFDKGALKEGKLPGKRTMRLNNLEDFLGITHQRTLPVSYNYAKSCLVATDEKGEEIPFQTLITDLVHKNFLQKLRFVNRIAGMDKYQSYKNIEEMQKHIQELGPGEYPSVNMDVVRTIEETRGIIVMGNGSLFTSLLPNLLYPEIVQAIIEKRAQGFPVAFIVKIKADIETSKDIKIVKRGGKFYLELGKTMPLKKQLEIILEHIREITNNKKLKLNDMMSHIIMPASEFTEEYKKKKYNSVEIDPKEKDALEYALKEGEAQVSKKVKGFQKISDLDREFINQQGITIINVEEKYIKGKKDKKPMYRNKKLYKIIMNIANEGFINRSI